MKILAINGSPRPAGNTYNMLKTVLDLCSSAGIETELYQAGGLPVRGCLACLGCATHTGRCATDDWVNEVYQKMKHADAILIGSPTYVSDLSAEIKALIDRVSYVSRRDGMSMSRKVGAAVTAVRRAGGVCTLDSIQHFFLLNDMIVPGSTYWNMSLARDLNDYDSDEEGKKTMVRLGENIVWILQKIGDII
jgi:multimeric flavodoxin WrbA